VIDEALSVGDGEFARKSFDRIIALREAGKTILFCSHSLYQVEALCNRVLWLDKGEMRALGEPGEVNCEYQAFLDAEEVNNMPIQPVSTIEAATTASLAHSKSRITGVELRVDGEIGKNAWSGESTVSVTVNYVDMEKERTSVAVSFFTQDGRCVTSAGSINDGISLQVAKNGHGSATVLFERIALLKGIYSVTVWLLCDKALFIHDGVRDICHLKVLQSDLTQGLVRLPHRWNVN
jgi:lipopolysaccharide transport system ATP-binding protein